MNAVINLRDKLTKFSDHWAPKVIAQMNDYQFKLVKIQGEFLWHRHADTDEAFIVLDGEMNIELRDGAVHLKAGEIRRAQGSRAQAIGCHAMQHYVGRALWCHAYRRCWRRVHCSEWCVDISAPK